MEHTETYITLWCWSGPKCSTIGAVLLKIQDKQLSNAVTDTKVVVEEKSTLHLPMLSLSCFSECTSVNSSQSTQPVTPSCRHLNKFVMWMHIDTGDYEWARLGIATSETVIGPYKFLRSFRPHNQQARDFAVFQVASIC